MIRGLAAALCLLIPSLTFAAPAIPDSPAGKVFGEWLTSFNDADRAAIQTFKDKYKRRTPVEAVLEQREDTGGFDIVRLEKQEPLALTAILRERSAPDAQYRFAISVTDGQPTSINKVEFEDLPIPRMSEADVLASLDARTHLLAEKEQFSGAVLVARHDKVLFEKAYGAADRAKGTPNTIDTQFRHASLGKMFTAIATLQLVEAGKLSLDGHVSDYLKDYPNKEMATKVTVRHLLTHTGGTGPIGFADWSGFKSHQDYLTYRDQVRTHSDYVRRHGDHAPEFEPGSKFDYSNYGFVLLGAIIERVSGQNYYDYIDQHVFAPAGMTATGNLPETEAVPHRATGYMRKDNAWISNSEMLSYRGMAAGGGYTTVGDMLKFAQALESGKLISKRMLADATKSQIKEGWYGYGFFVVGQGPARRFGHVGDHEGMCADFRVFPESGYVLISLSNIDPPSANRPLNYFEPRMPIE